MVSADVGRGCETCPIAEAETVMGRSTPQIDDETEDDETNNGDDFD